MRNSLLAVALILVTVLVDPLTTTPSSSPTLTSSLNPTPSEYELHQLMESALYNNSYNMYKLSRAFFPVPFANAPVCVVVSYAITCSNSSSSPSCPNDFGDSDGSETYLSCDSGGGGGGLNVTYLWSLYNLGSVGGELLTSFSTYGMVLRGFDWEEDCRLNAEATEISLDLGNITRDCYSVETVLRVALELTSNLLIYAKAQGKPFSYDPTNRAYALKWVGPSGAAWSNITVVAFIAVLNLFVLLLCVSTTSYTYTQVYNAIKKKNSPFYAIFWSLFLLSLLWNLGPFLFVFTRIEPQVYIPLAILVPTQLVIAVFTSKKKDFPVPFCGKVKSGGHHHIHLFSQHSASVSKKCSSSLTVSNVVQTLFIWNFQVFVTVLIYYFAAAIVAFYLSPLQTLIRLACVKAGTICIVFNVAIAISLENVSLKKHWRENAMIALSFATIACFLPIVVFLLIVIGGIIFSDAVQFNSGAVGVLTVVITTVFFVVVAWISRDTFIPGAAGEIEEIATAATLADSPASPLLTDAAGSKSASSKK